ncbi:DUF4192 family protein [Lipingzhangella halophila]|uniref:DUF4192 family protein n=1 Tax=Lipingzhangella halophila TaxID=1783352 RepID=UPI001C87C920
MSTWGCGARALAETALDEVDQAHPEYSTARLLRYALRAGLPPRECEPTPEWEGFRV